MESALIVVEVQNDFCESGTLPAKNTNSLIEPMNKIIKWAILKEYHIFFTRDWHPEDHYSFVSQGGVWPPHCVQNSFGADFAKGLIVPDSAIIIDIEKDSLLVNMRCSAFINTSLKQILEKLEIKKLIVTGIATDYAVKSTALDALQLGYDVTVLTDLIRPIDIQADDSNKAIRKMKDAGAILLESIELFKNEV